MGHGLWSNLATEEKRIEHCSIGRVLFQAVPDPVCFPVLFALIGPVTVRFAVTLDEIASRSLQKSGT